MARSGIAAGLTAALALALACAACGSPGPPQHVTSTYETATGRHIVRDCGYSVPLPGPARRSLWLFCDTLVTGKDGKEIGGPILGAGTAAEGPYTAGQAPGALTEVATPAHAPAEKNAQARAAPQPFLPVPANLTLPGGTLPCAGPQTYPARWVTGAAREPGPSGHVLISYTDYCVSGGDVFTPEAFGLVDYDPAGNVLGAPVQVLAAPAGQPVPPQWVLGSPVFSGGYLYLSGFRCAVIYYATCLKHSGNAIYLARVGATPLAWNNAASYQWYAGRAGWTAAAVLAASVIGGVTPLAVSVDDFTGVGRGFVLIEETTGGGGFTLYQAAAPAGPWRRIRDGRVPCTADKRAGGLGLCRALIPHPELSTRDGLLISFFNPQDDHVEVAAQSW